MVGRGAALGLALGILLVAGRGGAAEPTPAGGESQVLTADPAIRQGLLANGLRYQVLSNATPKGAISIRLAIGAGSYDETDDERGLAHFVEHMAFRASASFPEGQLEKTFAPMGVGFGRDHNAATGYRATVYRMDLPDPDQGRLDAAFRWLRDVADGVTFAPAQVDRERGVVLAEKEATNSPQQIVNAAVERFRAPGLRSTERDPIGAESVLRTADAVRLRGFYDRWYRPDNATVVVVGDMPVEALEARVRTAFETWTAKGPTPAHPPAGRIDPAQGLEVLSLSEPGVALVVSACRLRPIDPQGPEEVADLRRRALTEIWISVLTQRLNKLRVREGSLLASGVDVSDETGEARTTCIGLTPTGEAWEAALGHVQAELRRFERDGPTDLELELALETQRANLVALVPQAATLDSGYLASEISGRALKGRVWPQARQGVRAFNLATEDLTPADVLTAFQRDWAGAGPFVAATAPAAPAREAVLAAWTRNATAQGLEKYADTKSATWAYARRDKAAPAVSREARSDPDYVRITFANGTILNFKQTAYAKGTVELRMMFGQGRRELENQAYLPAVIGSGLFSAGGVGRHSYEELVELFGSTSLDFDFDVGDDAFLISESLVRTNLAPQLQLLATYLSDPGFRDTLDSKIPSAIELTYRRAYTDIPEVLGQAIDEAATPGSPGNMPPPARLTGLTSKDFAKALRAPITQSPLEITVVGDISEAAAVESVGQTFGMLPPRAAVSRARADNIFVRFADHPPREIYAIHQGPPDKAGVMLVWPLYVAVPARRREEYVLKVLAQIFSDELRHAVRERLGKTYSPDVVSNMPDLADQGRLVALVETYPSDLGAAKAEALAIAARLARGEISADMLSAAREPMLSGDKSFRQTDKWWAITLAGTSGDGQLARNMMEVSALTGEVTLEDLKKAAATWLSQPPWIAIATSSQTAKDLEPRR